MNKLLELINNYGRACSKYGNPAWESKEGVELAAYLAAEPSPDGFSASDMASAAAQGYRDGVAAATQQPSSTPDDKWKEVRKFLSDERIYSDEYKNKSLEYIRNAFMDKEIKGTCE